MVRVRQSAQPAEGVKVLEIVGRDMRTFALEPTDDLDLVGRGIVTDMVAAAGTRSEPVVLDCRGVEVIGSHGVGIIVSMWRTLRKAGRRFAVCTREPVRHVFRVNRLDTVIPFFDDVATAVAAVRETGPGASKPTAGG